MIGNGSRRNAVSKTAVPPLAVDPPERRASVARLSVTGTARVDSRTKRLLTRLQPGEIAFIDHADLDRAAAEALLAGKVRAVVNAAPSTTGRYPNRGPLLLAEAGVPVIDRAGPELLDTVNEGQQVTVRGPEVLVDGEVVAVGTLHTPETLRAAMEAAKARLGEELGRFAENTLEYLKRERHVMLERPPAPDVGVDFTGRHALVAVRGHSTEADIAMLRPYIREQQPVLIAVDGGADALVKAKLVPDIIVGDFDSVTTETLHCGATLVVHAYPDGRAPGAARLEELGLPYITYESHGVSEDVAMLLAGEKGAELVVAVGTHSSMHEFLEKGRDGMASTFLTRLLLGNQLVDAKGVSQLYGSTVRKRELAVLLLAYVAVILVVFLFFPQSRVVADSLWFLFTEWLG